MAQDFAGKVVLLTGATDGIGKAAAMEFAKRGANLTIVGRNKEKTENVVAELKAASGNQKIDFLLCDLSRMDDVRRAADKFKATHDRLDVLANNAGATFKKTPTSTEGSGPSAYATSKLSNVLFTKELQRRLEGTTATANCFEPGMVRTQFGGFGSDQGFLVNLVYTLAKPFSSTPEQGADSMIWLAMSREAASLRGQFVSKRRPIIPSKQAQDPQLATDLWTLSEKLCAQTAA